MSEASIKNRALAPFNILIGEWTTVGHHPFVDETLHGWATFEWVENGAFVMMRTHVEHKDFPDGIAILGSDDSDEEFSMIYFDERTVSRKYICTINDNVWKWWRIRKDFSQSCVCEIRDNGNTIVAKGEMSREGKPWEKDLELTYTRVQG